MQPGFQPLLSASTPILVESDTAILSEGLCAIVLPLGLFVAILMRKNRKRHLLKRQIAMLERLWQSSDKVQ